MEPNKFEEHIRTKFEERELQPSKEAWSKLESQLGESQRNNNTLWYAIAASLVAILVVGSFLLSGNEEVSKAIVEESPNVENDATGTEVANSEENDSDQQINTPLFEEPVITKEEISEQRIASTDQSDKSPSEVQEVLSKKDEVKQNGIAKNESQAILLKDIEKKDIVTLKVDEVVTEVKRLTLENKAVTPQEIEALLAQAQRDISNQRLLKEATTTIDPASLLQDVETEMERSCRDKVGDALGEGFNKIRTAVVERNN